MKETRKLIESAFAALPGAYAPYSGFKVAAALLCADGSIYTGINIENAAYTPTNCAERTAFFKAISEGKREFSAIAVCGGVKGRVEEYTFPCGVCRQVMREFCDPKSFMIYIAKSKEEYRAYTLEELLPEGFGPENLRA
ncbi:MAG: cytidine deaminase [Johnsonella sp.]|nr:cytidine deaminase [Johnsonella sp.]